MSFALLIDIGNTNMKVGLTSKSSLMQSFTLPTHHSYTADSLGIHLQMLMTHLGVSPDQLETALASSVVPAINPILAQACKKFLTVDLFMVPGDIPIPLENRYAEPAQVGADRLVGAYAARRLFPEAASLICVDYGTATTFDCVDGNAYLGGLICPGLLSSASALSSRTAQLPLVSLETSADFPEPGRSTVQSISHGFIFGFAAMTQGLCSQLKTKLPSPCLVVGTGGFARSLARVTDCFDVIRPELLLEGLRFIYSEHE